MAVEAANMMVRADAPVAEDPPQVLVRPDAPVAEDPPQVLVRPEAPVAEDPPRQNITETLAALRAERNLLGERKKALSKQIKSQVRRRKRILQAARKLDQNALRDLIALRGQ